MKKVWISALIINAVALTGCDGEVDPETLNEGLPDLEEGEGEDTVDNDTEVGEPEAEAPTGDAPTGQVVVTPFKKHRVIIGNGKKRDRRGYVQVGFWQKSSLKGFKRSESRYSRESDAMVYYAANLQEGRYCLSVYRVTHPNSTDRALWNVYGFETTEMDHSLSTKNKGWVNLGVYSIEAPRVQVVSLSQGGSGVLRADEIRWRKVKDGFDCLGRMAKIIKRKGIIDNRRNKRGKVRDTAGYRQFGEWNKSSLKGHKKSESRYSKDAQAKVTYTASLKFNAYCVSYYRVAHPNSIDRARVTLTQGGETLFNDTHSFDHSTRDSGWVDLGAFLVEPNTEITLTLQADPNGHNGGFLRADAVKFKRCQVAGSIPTQGMGI